MLSFESDHLQLCAVLNNRTWVQSRATHASDAVLVCRKLLEERVKMQCRQCR